MLRYFSLIALFKMLGMLVLWSFACSCQNDEKKEKIKKVKPFSVGECFERYSSGQKRHFFHKIISEDEENYFTEFALNSSGEKSSWQDKIPKVLANGFYQRTNC